MGWQPGSGGTGERPVPEAGPPGRPPGRPGPPGPARDPGLPGFAEDGEWDSARPSAALAIALEAASGAEWGCPGATRDEMLGLLRQWQALEAWAAAGKLGLLRALVREDDQPLPGGGYHGDLPDGWTRSLTHEVALALAMPAVSAERLMWLAWNLQATLPGTGALLAAGELTLAKARAVDSALASLTDADAAKAEAMILPDLPGKTYGQAEKLALQAAIAVDPESATRRREDAERHKSRVQLFREESGAAGLSGRDLPTDQTLAAHAMVCARAQQYKDSGVFDRDTRMDQFRVAAYLDLLNEITAAARIASGQLVTVTRTGTAPAEDSPAGDGPARDDRRGDPEGGQDQPDDGGDPGGNPGSGDGGPSKAGPSDSGAALSPPRLVDLVLPLATLLGLAERPGESHGLGPLDPELCRQLATAAAASPHSRLCVTVTGPGGIPIGHGCARAQRRKGAQRAQPAWEAGSPGDTPRSRVVTPAALAPLPARVNLTITSDRLADLARCQAINRQPATTGPPGEPPWSFTRHDDSGPPGGDGTWTLTLPDGRNLTVELEPLPVLECDHRHESHAYQPNEKLRHLVQVRDYECTFPTCSRHARTCDFEHAIPYDQGGRTCACNAGARSRQCHQVKQSPGWSVTQPKPGWHQWETPSGRRYTQGPKRYQA